MLSKRITLLPYATVIICMWPMIYTFVVCPNACAMYVHYSEHTCIYTVYSVYTVNTVNT